MPKIIEKDLGLTKLLQKQNDAFLGHSVDIRLTVTRASAAIAELLII